MDKTPVIRFKIYEFRTNRIAADVYSDDPEAAFDLCIRFYHMSSQRQSYYYKQEKVGTK